MKAMSHYLLMVYVLVGFTQCNGTARKEALKKESVKEVPAPIFATPTTMVRATPKLFGTSTTNCGTFITPPAAQNWKIPGCGHRLVWLHQKIW